MKGFKHSDFDFDIGRLIAHLNCLDKIQKGKCVAKNYVDNPNKTPKKLLTLLTAEKLKDPDNCCVKQLTLIYQGLKQ